MNAEKVVQDVTIPLFIAHGKDNLLHPIEESQSLFKLANEPKQLYVIDGKHNDFMYHEHHVFQDLISRLEEFFEVHLANVQKVELV
jgi:fermentation-respiration switch protein FrsA (DUF1100 family)